MSIPSMIWGVADTFAMDLKLAKNGKSMVVVGQDINKEATCGPWSVDMVKTVRSDFCFEHQCGLFFKIRKNLWGYLVAAPGSLVLYLLDAKVAGLNSGEMQKAGEGSVAGTLKKLGAAIKGSFCYNSGSRSWERYLGINAAGMGQGKPTGPSLQAVVGSATDAGDQASVFGRSERTPVSPRGKTDPWVGWYSP
jgi:hypothetical protein